MNTVVWSPKAEDAYLAILETTYYFSTSAALELDEKLEKLLDRLRKFKHSCPPAPTLPGVRRCVVTKNVSLAYEIFGDTVQVLTVVDNRMENLL